MITSNQRIDWEIIEEIYRSRKEKEFPIAFSVDDNFVRKGILGNIVRVNLKFKNKSPSSVIVKYQECTDKKREKTIYNLLSDRNITFIPEILYSFDDGTIVMEDLSDYIVKPKKNGLNYDESLQVLNNISIVHGYFWNDNRLPKESPDRFSKVINYNMEQCWDIFQDRYSEKLNAFLTDFKWMWHNSDLVSQIYLSEQGTLVHGDLHIENILFDPKDYNSIYIIDWQLSSYKTPAFDLSFFLVQNLQQEERSKNEARLLRNYYHSLPDNVKEKYPYKKLILEYRACLTRSMLSAVMMVGPRFKELQNQMENADIVVERVLDAVHDLQPIEAIRELTA